MEHRGMISNAAMDTPRAFRLLLSAFLLLFARIAFAEQLPLKVYTTAEGLPSDTVRCILSDSHGFLWFGTSDGISRFDGYEFVNLTRRHGFPGTAVNAIVEAADGTYWAGTNAGIFHWDPAGAKSGHSGLPEVFHVGAGSSADDVRALVEGRDDFWAGTQEGLYRLEGSGGGRRSFHRFLLETPESSGASHINALHWDSERNLWIGTESGLFRKSPSNVVERIRAADGSPHAVRSLLSPRGGGLLAGSHAEGLFEVQASGIAGQTRIRRLLSRSNGLAGDYVVTLLETRDGQIWAGCFGGMSELAPDATLVRSDTTVEGLSGIGVWSLAEDRNGNLWIGSENAGLMRFARHGFRRFDSRDGLAGGCVSSLFENRDGALCAFTRGTRPEQVAVDDSFIECFQGGRFRSVRPRVLPGTSFGWGTSQVALQDGHGEWWVPTIRGLYRFPAVSFSRLEATAPRRIYTERDGLPSDVLYRLFEDGRGDIWAGFAAGTRRLALWDRRTDSWRVVSGSDGIPVAEEPLSFAEDRTGAVWIGFKSGLGRMRGMKSTFFRQADGLPEGGVESLLRDRLGRLWIACDAEGIARLDHPEQERPDFVTYGVAQGLSSGHAFSLTEDRWGRIYIGTARGLDRLDPKNGLVQHFTTDDGLARGDVEASFRDQQGTLWFGSPQGMSRLEPVADEPKAPPPIRIARVIADGVRQSLPDLGVRDVRLPGLGPGSAPIQIDFLAIDFSPGGHPRYQYFLEGIDNDWSAVTDRRSVIYGRLASGPYRFRVRGVANDGSIGQTPAEVRFEILPPFWRRPEVLALAIATVAALAYLVHRSRLKSALAVERVRTRVATDLHDDIGAGLSEIAILSEVLQWEGPGERARHILREIGDGARRMVDSMSDIVWSTDPRNDDVASLAQRIRAFAVNVLESKGIRWALEMPLAFDGQRLDPEIRQQVLLILKEAITNVARHSGCSRASIRIVPGAHALVVEVEDDGAGLPTSGVGAPVRGHGLANMRRRALSLGGQFQIGPGSAGGALLVVRVPVRSVPARNAGSPTSA